MKHDDKVIASGFAAGVLSLFAIFASCSVTSTNLRRPTEVEQDFSVTFLDMHRYVIGSFATLSVVLWIMFIVLLITCPKKEN